MTFADFIVGTFTELHAPGTSGVEYTFKDPKAIHACIERLLRRCDKYEKLSGLADNLNNAAKPLYALWHTPGSPEAAHAHDKMLRIAVDFENYLQLIATIRYPVQENRDLFEGTPQHFGIFESQLGQLLRGNLRPKGSPRAKGTSGYLPGKPIVTFNDRGRSPRDRSFLLALEYRNEVHDAEAMNTLALVGHVQQLCAAFLFATEENLAVLQGALFEFRDAMGQLVARCRGKRPPFYLPLAFAAMKKDKGRYVLDRSAPDRGETLDTLQHKAHAAPDELAVVLLGEPGAGKSTVVHELAVHQAQAVLKSPFSRVRVPVLLEAKDITEHRPLLQLICSQLGCVDETATALAREGRLLIVLDGLNELPTRLVSPAKNELKVLAQDFPEVSFVVTGRRHVSTVDLPFRHLWVCDLTVADIRTYVEHVVSDKTEAARFCVDLEAVPRLLKLCHSPLLLWMLTEISRETETATNHTRHVLRIPENTGRLLKQFMSRFLDRERDQGNLSTADGLTAIDPATVHDVLAYLALKMRERNEVVTTRERCIALIEERLPSLQTNIGANDFLTVVCHARILDLTDEQTVRFFHELVQEYFAAAESVRCWRGGDAAPRVLGDDADWMETRKLFYGLLEPAEQSKLIPRLAETDVAGSALCVMDAIHPNPGHQQVILNRAATDLRHASAAAPSALLAYARIWNDEARQRVLKYAHNTSKLRDFLAQCADDPISQGLDLLRLNPSRETLGAVVDVIKSAAPAGLEEPMAERLCELVVSLLTRHSAELSRREQLGHFRRLARSARLPREERSRDALLAKLSEVLRTKAGNAPVVAAISIGALGVDPAVDAESLGRALGAADLPEDDLMAVINACASRGDITQSELRSHAARTMMAGRASLALPFLRRIGDKTWMHPWLCAVVDSMLDAQVGMLELRDWLTQATDADGARAVYQYLLNTYRMPPAGLSVAFEALGTAVDAVQVKADYFRTFLAREAYADALEVLRMIPVGVLARSELEQDMARLRERGAHILATDLEIKMQRSGNPDAMDERVAVAISDTLRSSQEPERFSYACRTWWSHMPDDMRRDTLRAIVATRHITKATIEGWSPEALCMLRSERDAAVATGNTVTVDIEVAIAINALDEYEEPREHLAKLPRERPHPDLVESGEAPASSVRKWHQRGSITDDELKRWACARLAVEDVEAVLGVKTRESTEILTSIVADHIERFLREEKFAAAGSMMVAFCLATDYMPVLPTVVPALLTLGKPGLAKSLASVLGTTYQPEFAGLVGDTFRHHLCDKAYKEAESLVTLDGLSLHDSRFADLVAEEIVRLLAAGKGSVVEELLSAPALAQLPWRNRARGILREGQVTVPVEVAWVSDRGFAGCSLPYDLGSVFMPPRVMGRDVQRLQVGDVLQCVLRPNDRKPDDMEAFTVERIASPFADVQPRIEQESLRPPRHTKAVGKGQERTGMVVAHDHTLAAALEGDESTAAIENASAIPDRSGSIGKKALFYVVSVNKRDGISVRFLRFL